MVVVAGVVALSWLLWPLLESLPQTWPVGTAVAFFMLITATVLRAYVVTITTAKLQNSEQSVWTFFVASQRRVPVIIIILIATLAVAGITIGVASTISWGFVVTIPFVSEAIYDGASATLIFGSLSGLVVFKFWLAPEICVAGKYGPLTALKLSWSVTSLYWFRVLVVVTGFAVTVYFPEVVGRVVASAGGEWLLWSPATGLLQLFFYGVGYVLWFAVGTQIYIRSLLVQQLSIETPYGR